MSKTVRDLVVEYFAARPGDAVRQADVATWVMREYEREHGRPCMDPWREVRRLCQKGTLIKLKKGYYKFEASMVERREIPDFSPEVKEEIFRHDGYRCVICGRGKANGVEIHADHIIPPEKGGGNGIGNGQTLCSQHNILKKNYAQTEAGKRYFIKLYKQAVAKGDEKMVRFCEQVFNAYNKHEINRHIARPNKENV